MSIDILLMLILACCFLMFSALFSGSELIMVSLDKFLLKSKAAQGSKSANKVLAFLEKPSEFLLTTLLANNICNIASTTLAAVIVINLFGEKNVYFAGLIMAPLILLFGEFIPKKFGQKYADKLALIVIYPLLIAKKILSPITFLTSRYSMFLSKMLGIEQTARDFVPSRNELRLVLEHLGEKTDVKEHEKEMVENVLYLPELSVAECMTPLAKVHALPVTATAEDALKIIKDFGHSRIPVFENRIDNIIGFVLSFDFFEIKSIQTPLKDILIEPLYVSEVQPLDDLMGLLQKEGQHMAIVVDEYGAATGVITVEDVFEEIVGDIEDEHDEEQPEPLKKISNNVCMVDANIEVDIFNEQYGFNVPEGDYSTLGGYLLELFEKIPSYGEKIEDADNIYIVSKASNRKIIELIVKSKKGEFNGNGFSSR